MTPVKNWPLAAEPPLMSPTGYISPRQSPGNFFWVRKSWPPGQFFCLYSLPQGKKNDDWIPGGVVNFETVQILYLENLTNLYILDWSNIFNFTFVLTSPPWRNLIHAIVLKVHFPQNPSHCWFHGSQQLSKVKSWPPGQLSWANYPVGNDWDITAVNRQWNTGRARLCYNPSQHQ